MSIGSIIGIAVFILSFFISAIIIKKYVRAKTKFKRIVLSTFTFVFITVVMSFFSVTMENLVLKFDNPEKAFHFNHSEEIIDIVNGESSCMVIYKENKNTTGVYYLYKSNTGYKTLRFFSSKEIKNVLNTDIGISIDRVLGTDDYYVHGLSALSENNVCISNEKKDTFGKFLLESDINSIKTFLVYDYLDNYETDNYSLIINDEEINIKEDLERQRR